MKQKKNHRSFYQHFHNVDKSINTTLAEEYDKSIIDMEDFNDFSNFCENHDKVQKIQ